jgi:GAF domain-containing protein
MATQAAAGPLDSAGPESAALIRALAEHPEEMAHLIEVLHSRVDDAPSLLDLFDRVTTEALRLLHGVGWAGITALFDDGYPLTAAHTDALVLIVDEWQYAGQDGPCLQAMRTGVPVAMSLPAVQHRWPPLGRHAAQVGVRSFLAIPLHAGRRSAGVLNLYSPAEKPPQPDGDLLTVLTEYAGRALTAYGNSRPHPTAEQALRNAQDDRTAVTDAVEVLMTVHGFQEDYAHDVLSDQAQDWGRTLAAQAAYVVAQNVATN